MTSNLRLSILCCLGLLACRLAFGGPQPIPDSKNMIEQAAEPECNWYLSIGGGVDFDYGSTEFVREHNIPGAVGVATLRTPSESWDEAFDLPYRIQAELGYALGEHFEIFGRFAYNAADGQNTEAYLSVTRIGVELDEKWGDYRSYGGEVGLRYFFLRRDAIVRPFLSLSGGATHAESIGVTVRAANTAAGFTTGDVLFDGAFYGNSTVATGSVLAGLEVRVTRCFAIGADAGLRYESKLAQDNSDLDRLNFGPFGFPTLSRVNDNAGDRLTCPVTFYAKIRF